MGSLWEYNIQCIHRKCTPTAVDAKTPDILINMLKWINQEISTCLLLCTGCSRDYVFDYFICFCCCCCCYCFVLFWCGLGPVDLTTTFKVTSHIRIVWLTQCQSSNPEYIEYMEKYITWSHSYIYTYIRIYLYIYIYTEYPEDNVLWPNTLLAVLVYNHILCRLLW